MNRWIWLAPLLAIALAGGCIFVDHQHRHQCWEGDVACHEDFVEECVDGEWWIVEDCWDACGGYCAYDRFDEPVCFCP